MDETNYIPLRGSELPIISRAVEEPGTPEPKERIEVQVCLRSKPSNPNPPSQGKMAASPLHQQKRIPEEDFVSIYGADPEDVYKIEKFAWDHELCVEQVSLTRRCVYLNGTISQMEKAFSVTLKNYSYESGGFRGYKGPVNIPKELEDIVIGVFGLSNPGAAQANIHPSVFQEKWLTGRKKVEEGKFNLLPYFTPSQAAQAYNFPTDVTGQGQTAGIIVLGGGYTRKTLDMYFGTVNALESREDLKTPNIIDVNCGADNSPGNWLCDLEVCGDIEVLSSIANDADVVVYFGKDGSESAFLRSVSTAITDFDNFPAVISISFGGNEDDYTDMFKDIMNSWFQLAAEVMNITICAASGDTGSSCRPSLLAKSMDDSAHVVFPASSPWVLACGGTYLIIKENGKQGEIVWNEGTSLGVTGGGVSNHFNSWPKYQEDNHVRPRSKNDGQPGRGIPDVAGNAAHKSGYLLMSNNSPFMFNGGTSAVAPLWAALIALFNEKLSKDKELLQPVRLGFINPLLYQIKNSTAFKDITEGNNEDYPGVPFYEAGPGWDGCTGLGTPNGEELYKAICHMLKKEKT